MYAFETCKIVADNGFYAIMPFRGYMSPESGQHGLFSEKSDVYSFGVLFLEILSGKKNTDVHNSETRGLVAYVSSYLSMYSLI